MPSPLGIFREKNFEGPEGPRSIMTFTKIILRNFCKKTHAHIYKKFLDISDLSDQYYFKIWQNQANSANFGENRHFEIVYNIKIALKHPEMPET